MKVRWSEGDGTFLVCRGECEGPFPHLLADSVLE